MRHGNLSQKSVVFAAVLAATLVSGCGKSPEADVGSSNADTVMAPAVATEEAMTDAAPVLPDHNYDEKRGWNYYYVAAVSDEDRKKGRAAGAVVTFQYLGVDDDGNHVLALMNPDGTVDHKASCSSSCRIIDLSYGGNMAYSTDSIIGAAFQDAFRGKLKIADWVKDEVVPVARDPAPKVESTRAIPTGDVSSDEPWEADQPVADVPEE